MESGVAAGWVCLASMKFTDGGAIFRASTLFFLPSIVGKLGALGRASPTSPLPALTTLTGT